MKTANRFLVSMFNFMLAFTVLSLVGFPTEAVGAIAGATAIGLNFVPSINGAMFTGFITNGSEFYGKEMEEIIIRPLFIGKAPQELGVRVINSVKSSIKLTFFKTKSKILKAYADGFQGDSGADKVQKKMTLSEFKAEAEYSMQDYRDTILENITSVGGIKQNEITGTAVHEAEVRVFLNAILEDVRRIFWLGNTSKKTLHANGYYTATADTDYNVIDGIWKAIFGSAALYSSATNDQIRRIVMSNGAVAQVDTVTLTGSSGTANINVDGVNYLATFNSSLTQTATDFDTTHSAALALRGITVTSSGADVIFTAAVAGQPHLVVAPANVSGNLAGSVAHTTANTAAQDLGTDEAKNTFKLMLNNSTQVLKQLIKEKGSVRIYATDSMIENYQDTLEAQSLESSRTAMIDGVQRFTYRGIPIIPMSIDHHLLADFNEPYPHRAILTHADNLCLVVNGTGDIAQTKFWFNVDENKNRQRTQFEFGADFVLPELITVAY